MISPQHYQQTHHIKDPKTRLAYGHFVTAKQLKQVEK